MSKNDPTQSEKRPAFMSSPRCRAKTRAGTPCKNPRVRDLKNGGYKSRCRMHGCGGRARGRKSGAPYGNSNAVTHAEFSRETLEWRRKERDRIKEIRDFLDFVISTNG